MNYIRGAVSAISAPYQYYKDLPPINPSTLTGAIDVIVIQRPSGDGDTELACSPFHVRFGKWQVLRPGEKQVNVFVNGHPIPYNMKIGEAGEAFFVFETDGDVPDDLITSPILHPTRPDEVAQDDAGVSSERLDATQGPDNEQNIESEQRSRAHLKGEDAASGEDSDIQEPEFLDLNALPSPPRDGEESPKNFNVTPKQTFSVPSMVRRPSHISITQPTQALPSPPPTPDNLRGTHTPEMMAQDERVDRAIRAVHQDLHVPQVDYRHDLALDVEGYHAHDRERSDRTIRSSEKYPFPSGSRTRSRTPSPVYEAPHTQHVQSESEELHTFPSFRATSEPPPDSQEHHDDHIPPSKLNVVTGVQEYSWEWGAFPQPSPLKTSFGKGGRVEGRPWSKGKGKAKTNLSSDLPLDEYEEEAVGVEGEHGRSRSVPPELDGSPARSRKGRELPDERDEHDEHQNYEEPNDEHNDGTNEADRDGGDFTRFGKGGKLTMSSTEPTQFILTIEGKKVTFELSLVESGVSEISSTNPIHESVDDTRGRKDRREGSYDSKIFDGRDEVEAARLFSQGQIDFHRFMTDEDIVDDSRLVIRWAGDQYIARSDGSPLMPALVAWRDTVRQQDPNGEPRPSSPPAEGQVLSPSPLLAGEHEQPADRMYHTRSQSEPPEKFTGKGKPTSLSWVQWWSRSRRVNTGNSTPNGDAAPKEDKPSVTRGERPGLRGAASAPLANGLPHLPSDIKKFDKRISREIPTAESAPALPSTPVQEPVKGVPFPTVAPETPVKRKYAKTLRLTSDQLKALNLKPGANTITFSLSSTGVVACTARIFVWDSTDLVVISDIDGTITKSDGLGHVFAMIGRDWTHIGVAKLYTDITRNGYKIMYLTSRAIGQADATRDYLKGIKQNDYQLPEGPVIMSPDRLMASLHREVIMRKPEVFKMACLRDIQRLFGEASRNPFYAGFGNRITDALSYRSVNVPSARIFTIDSTGEVKMELLELAGYKSSYIHMTDLVDQMFPPIHRKWAPEFTDFNYWKPPVHEFPLPDFSPPSPALSARSDTSNQSALARLRNFSLRQAGGRADAGDAARAAHLRQISSFEKLSNTLGFSYGGAGTRRSASPASSAEDSDEEGEGAEGRPRRERRRSMTSMPGSLDDMHFGMDDDEEEEGEGGYGGYDGYGGYGGGGGDDGGEQDGDGMGDEEAGDEAFDDDLLAVDGMKDVPFL